MGEPGACAAESALKEPFTADAPIGDEDEGEAEKRSKALWWAAGGAAVLGGGAALAYHLKKRRDKQQRKGD